VTPHDAGFVDLRSDTVTKPTAEMREAMARADVGDDCYGEDPTINRLQELAAEMLGKQAALFVPSGTMANQIAVKVLGAPGGEVICEEDCHLIHHESGACALLSQVQLRGLRGEGGVLSAEQVRDALRPDDPYQPRSVLVAIENTHTGNVWPIEAVRAVGTVAGSAGLPLFCDGARLFNATVAAGVSGAEYGEPADIVSISLYKGLAAPMGSLVCGTSDAIAEAWRYRRVFGGALRQAGIVAAAGIVALEKMVDRLAEDHANARTLADGFAAAAPDGTVTAPQTNMVLFDAASTGPSAVLELLRREGVLAGLLTQTVLRFVTHVDVDSHGIARAVDAFATVMKEITAVAS
jgi:threonine aldolase